MLQKIRDRITGWVAGLIFFFIAVAFALWGIDIGGSNQNFVAKVNGDDISLSQFRRSYQSRLNRLQQIYQTELPDQLRNAEELRLLEQFIEREVVRQHADQRGFRVGDEQLTEELRVRPEFQIDGEFSLDRYRAQLASVGQSSAFFEESFRGDMQMGQLVNGLNSTSFVLPSEFTKVFELRNETRDIGYLVVPAAGFKNVDNVTPEAIQIYYDDHQDEFVSEEKVDIDYIELAPNDYVEDVDVTEDEIRAEYESTIANYETPEQRDSRHILISTADRSEEEAEALATDLLTRINGGEDFGELAKEFSDDPGSGAEGGNLGWAEAQVYVGAFRDALFSMTEEEVRGGVKSEFGYHIIQMLGRRGGETKPFDSVSAEIEAGLRERRAIDRVETLKEEVQDLAYSSLDSLEPVADEFGLELKALDGITRVGGEGIAANQAVIESVFNDAVLFDNENSDLIEMDDGRFVVLRVREYHEVQTLPLEGVRDDIADILAQRDAEDEAREVGSALLARLREGESWDQVTADTDYEAKKAVKSTRSQAGIPSAILADGFAQAQRPDGEAVYRGVALADGGYAIYSMVNPRPGDATALTAEQRNNQEEQQAQRTGNTELTAFVGDLRDSASVVVNQEQLDQNQ